MREDDALVQLLKLCLAADDSDSAEEGMIFFLLRLDEADKPSRGVPHPRVDELHAEIRRRLGKWDKGFVLLRGEDDAELGDRDGLASRRNLDLEERSGMLGEESFLVNPEGNCPAEPNGLHPLAGKLLAEPWKQVALWQRYVRDGLLRRVNADCFDHLFLPPTEGDAQRHCDEDAVAQKKNKRCADFKCGPTE